MKYVKYVDSSGELLLMHVNVAFESSFPPFSP